jgi:hypothetical protein
MKEEDAMRTVKNVIYPAVATFTFLALVIGVNTIVVNEAIAEPPANAGGQDPVRPYQEMDLSPFDEGVVQNRATLSFSNPTLEDEVLVVEFVSATLTTDPDAVQAVVEVKVVDVASGIAVLSHRLVLAEQPPTGVGGTEAWEANQPILVFVGNDQTLEVVCTTNPPPNHVAAGCRASVAGFIRELAN